MLHELSENEPWVARRKKLSARFLYACIVALSAYGWTQKAAVSPTLCPADADGSLPDLVHTLEDKNKSASMRRDAVGKLTSFGQMTSCTSEVVSILINSLGRSTARSERDVRAADSRAIGVIFQSLREAPDSAAQLAAPALVRVLAKPDPDPIVRANAAWALGQLPERTATKATALALINTVKETHVNVGEAAALSLIGMSSTAIPELKAALGDPDANFRWKVAWILGQMGEQARDAVPKLASVLNNPQEDPNVRGAAAWAIGSIGRAANAQEISNFQNMISSLTQVLKNSNNDANIRSNAAWALGRLGPQVKTDNSRFPASVTEALEAGLADSDSDIRRNAAWALGQINPNPRVAVPALAAVLERDADQRVRVESAAANGQIGALGSNAKDAVNALSKRLNDPAPLVQAAAAVSLGELGVDAQAAVGLLAANTRKWPNSNDEERYAKFTAAEAVVKIAYALNVARRTEAAAALKRAADELELADDRDRASKVSKAAYDLSSLRVFNQFSGTLYWMQRYRAPLLAVCVYILFWFLLYWRNPFLLFEINEAMKPYLGYRLPKFLSGIPVSYLVLGEFFHYRPRVLDAWVTHNLGRAQRNFIRKATVEQRSVHVDLPVYVDKKPLSNLTVTDLRPSFQKKRTCILICGEGGAGKTSLACAICNWTMTGSGQQLMGHPVLGVLVEQEDLESSRGDSILTEAVCSQLWYLLGSTAAPSRELVQHLLRNRRILVVVDGLSEMSEVIRKEIEPGRPQFPAPALVITSRLEETPPAVDPTIIRPMRVSRDHLSTFMDAYLVQRAKKALFSDTEYFDHLSKLSSMAREREITVLLAKLYAEQMIAVKETPTDAKLPDNVPELMLQYINELNRKVKNNKVEDRLVHEVAKMIAWECLEQTLRAMPARVGRVIEKLGPRENIIAYLHDSLRIVQVVGAGRDRIRFTLDPLAEYLAALYKMEQLAADENGWREFVARIDSFSGQSEAIRGFLLALLDCSVTRGKDVGVPGWVITQITNRVEEKTRIHPAGGEHELGAVTAA